MARPFIRELFPAPAGPVTPTMSERPVSGYMVRSISSAPSASFSAMVMALATLPRRPARRSSMSMAAGNPAA